MLQQTPTLMQEFRAMYPTTESFVNSTAAARVNGYVVGYGSMGQLHRELDTLGLSVAGQAHLRGLVERHNR
ncbi:MAG: hypothetical protein AAF485_00320 [Chloroflexota bacterium]